MVKQVRIVAVLLIVEGAMEAFIGAVMTFAASTTFGEGGLRTGLFPVEILSAYLILGPAVLAAGLLKAVAGVRNLTYRNHRLGLIALASGLLAIPTCWCAPTALAIAVYGLIVYRHADVRAEFSRVETRGTP